MRSMVGRELRTRLRALASRALLIGSTVVSTMEDRRELGCPSLTSNTPIEENFRREIGKI
jgi:hypothetical protein